MKKIIRLCIFLFCCNSVAYAANVPSNLFSGMPHYLSGVANAWNGIFSEFGVSGHVAAYIQDVRVDNIAQYLDTISILGFNNTAMALFETGHHIGQSFGLLDVPMLARRGACPNNFINCKNQSKNIVVDGRVFGNFADYSAGENGDFNTRNTGFVINAHGYVADGWTLGVEYTRTMTDTRDNKVYSDAISNSIAVFSKYLSRHGLFVNIGANMGATGWDIDKSVAGISDDGVYDTDFYAAQINMGARMLRGRMAITPSVAVRYMRVYADKYIDDVLQSFSDWWYNALTVSGGVEFSFDFIGNDFIVRPNIRVGGGYDAISNGTDKMHVRLVDKQSYDIPIEKPHRAMFNGDIGIMFMTDYFDAALMYELDARSDYMSHTIMANVKIAF